MNNPLENERMSKNNFANIIANQNAYIATLQEKNRKLKGELNRVHRVIIPELNEFVTSLQTEIMELKAGLEAHWAAGEDW